MLAHLPRKVKKDDRPRVEKRELTYDLLVLHAIQTIIDEKKGAKVKLNRIVERGIGGSFHWFRKE